MDSDDCRVGRLRRTIWRVAGAAVLGVAVGGCGQDGQSTASPDQLASTDTADTAARPSGRLAAKLERTSYGVVHVRADDFRSLGYGLAYAYAQDNVCMFADTLLTVRGERSRYFGPTARATAPVDGEYGSAITYLNVNNEDSDFFFKGYLDVGQLRAAYASGRRESRDMLAGYAAGYNRYLKDAAGKLPRACAGAAWVRPITVEDVYLVIAEKALHASGEAFAKEIVDGARGDGAPVAAAAAPVTDPDFVRRRLARMANSGLGSNGMAFGKERTVNGRGMLLGNPHYPWTSTDRFYQAHLTVPGRYDAMGVILGGVPVVVIGFNRDVAWTHTVTTAMHFNTYKLALDRRDPSGTTYLIDGRPKKMRSRSVAIDVLQADGTLRQRRKTFYTTELGAVMVKADAGLTWGQDAVYVLADPNRSNTRLMDQWLGIGTARNVNELKAALDRVVGLPWVNILAADRDGNALFADASVVPNLGPERFAGDCLVLPALLMFDGSRSSCHAASAARTPAHVTPPAQGPWTIRQDYVANSNDSYWLNHAGVPLAGPSPLGYSPLYGPAAVAQTLRTRMAFVQLEEALQDKGKLGLPDIQRLAFSNRIMGAELLLPGFLPHCARAPDALTVQACDTLARWDQRSDLDSRGTILFQEFWQALPDPEQIWAVPFDPAHPLVTPRGIKPAALAQMNDALRQAAVKLQGLGIALDARLGDYQTEVRRGVRTGIHGISGELGSYNAIYMKRGLAGDGYGGVDWGTSYVQSVTFDEQGPVASGMLVYGQSTDPASPHASDQLPVYARKAWPALPFSDSAIKADPHYSSSRIAE